MSRHEAPWEKIPLDVADCDAGRRLRIATGRRLAWMHVVAAELWCKRYLPGRAFLGADAVARYESAAEWTGKRGALAEAAHLAGFIVVTSGSVRVLPLVEVVGAEWTPAAPAESADADDKAAQRRAKERARKAAKRADASGHAADKVRTRRGQSADKARTTADMSADNCGQNADTADKTPLSAPASARETQTQTETQTRDTAGRPLTGSRETPPPASRTGARKPAEHQVDGEAWLARYREATGDTQEPPGSWWARYGKARKTHGAQGLMDALAGCLTEPFWASKGPLALLGDAAIVQGKARHTRGATGRTRYDPDTTAYEGNPPELLARLGLDTPEAA